MKPSGPIGLRGDLRQSTSALQAMVDLCPLAMLALDLDGLVRLWSRGAERMFEGTEHEVVGHPLPFGAGQVDYQLPSGLEHANEIVCPRKDGRKLHVTFSVAPLHEEQGNLEGRILIFSDITPRRELGQ